MLLWKELGWQQPGAYGHDSEVEKEEGVLKVSRLLTAEVKTKKKAVSASIVFIQIKHRAAKTWSKAL